LYTFWRRIVTYPTFAVFDAPSRDTCVSRRPRSNTPLQALTALNDPVFVESARVLAQRVLLDGGSSLGTQMDYAFRLSLSRSPTKAEQQRLIRFYQEQLRSFESDPQAAETLTSQGATARPSQVDVRRLAAWTMVANALLNLDETLTKG
jgi:hypothetical protein